MEAGPGEIRSEGGYVRELVCFVCPRFLMRNISSKFSSTKWRTLLESRYRIENTWYRTSTIPNLFAFKHHIIPE